MPVYVSIPLWFDSNLRENGAGKFVANVFQFHSGSIQTSRTAQGENLTYKFQFHSGSIQTM